MFGNYIHKNAEGVAKSCTDKRQETQELIKKEPEHIDDGKKFHHI